MKRLVFLLILVSVTASLSGCRRGLFGNRCGGQTAPTYQAPACPPTCTCPPPTCVCPTPTCPVTVQAMPACSCGVSAAPAMSGSSFATGAMLAPSLEGQIMSSPAVNSVPMQGSGTVYGGALPMNGATNLQVVNDRALQPGESIVPSGSIKVGKK